MLDRIEDSQQLEAKTADLKTIEKEIVRLTLENIRPNAEAVVKFRQSALLYAHTSRDISSLTFMVNEDKDVKDKAWAEYERWGKAVEGVADQGDYMRLKLALLSEAFSKLPAEGGDTRVPYSMIILAAFV